MMTRLINLPMGRLIRMCLGVRRSRGNVNWCQLAEKRMILMKAICGTHRVKTLPIDICQVAGSSMRMNHQSPLSSVLFLFFFFFFFKAEIHKNETP